MLTQEKRGHAGRSTHGSGEGQQHMRDLGAQNQDGGWRSSWLWVFFSAACAHAMKIPSVAVSEGHRCPALWSTSGVCDGSATAAPQRES